jgi:hypothetical protein
MLVALIRRYASPKPERSAAPSPPVVKYADAFERVRLVRAWIGATAAMVALGYAFNALLDRLLP